MERYVGEAGEWRDGMFGGGDKDRVLGLEGRYKCMEYKCLMCVSEIGHG